MDDEGIFAEEAKKGLGLASDSSNYFDVFVFMADQQSIEVELTVEGPSAGLLDRERGEQHCKKGSKMTVPLAAAAALQDKQLALAQMPNHIAKVASRSAYTQESCCLLDLCSVCPVFFEYATRVAYLCDDDGMFHTVQRILRERLKKLAAILDTGSISRNSAPPRTFGVNASARAFLEALKQNAAGDQTTTNLEGSIDASRKTFIRGLTLSEMRVVDIRRRQLTLI